METLIGKILTTCWKYDLNLPILSSSKFCAVRNLLSKKPDNWLQNYHTSLVWPDPIFAQGRYHFLYKLPVLGVYTVTGDNAPIGLANYRVWPREIISYHTCM